MVVLLLGLWLLLGCDNKYLSALNYMSAHYYLSDHEYLINDKYDYPSST